MFAIHIDERYPQEIAPGNNVTLHHNPGQGLLLLAAIHRLDRAHIEQFHHGTIAVAVGVSVDPWVHVAIDIPGWGWADNDILALEDTKAPNPPGSGTAVVSDTGDTDGTDETEDLSLLREDAASWSTGRGHALVSGVLIDRDRDDTVVALRAFTLSPHVTRTLGKLLTVCYTEVISPDRYIEQITEWQRRNRDPGRWVRERSIARCRSGD